MASLKDFFLGKEAEIKQLPTLSSEQQSLLNQLLGGLGGPLGQGMEYLSAILGNQPGAFEAYEAPLKRQFQEEIVPGLAERFSSMGAGAQKSSAFGQQLGQAGAGLEERLAAQRAGLRGQALGQLGSLLGQGLGTPTFGYQTLPGTGGLLGNLSSGLGQALGTGASLWGLSKLFG